MKYLYVGDGYTVCAHVRGGNFQAWERWQFLFVDGSVMESWVPIGASGVRVWIFGRAVVNLQINIHV